MQPDSTPAPDAETRIEQAEESLGAGIDLADPHSPLARYFLSASQVSALVALALVFALFNMVALWHTDVWGHMKLGAWMVEHRAFPEQEPFLPFTDKSQKLVHTGWLSQVGYHGLFRLGEKLAGGSSERRIAGGVEILRLVHQLAVLTLYGLLWLAYRQAASSWKLAAVGLLFLVGATIGTLVFQRPQVFGQVCFAALLLLLARPLSRPEAFLGVPLLLTIWANLHGSFVLGLGYLGLTLVGRALGTRPLFRGLFLDKQLHRLLAALIVAVLVIAVFNPHGPNLFMLVARFGSHPNIATAEEWTPIRFHLGPGGQWLFMAVWAIILATQIASPRWFKPDEALVLIVFGLAPLLQQRLCNWWIMLTPVVLLPHWALIGERVRWRWLHYHSQPNFRKTLIALVPIGLVLLGSSPVQWLVRKGPKPLEEALYPATPWKLATELQTPREAALRPLPRLAQELQPRYTDSKFTGTIFCSETVGDYLYWALPRTQPVIAFSHVHLFPPVFWAEYLHARDGGPRWRAFMQRYGCNLVILEPDILPGLPREIRKDSEWVVILDESGSKTKSDPRARLFIALRRHPILPAPAN